MGSALPQDRESLFWFNVLEIPPKSKAKEGEFKSTSTRLSHADQIIFPPGWPERHAWRCGCKPEMVAEKEGNTLSLFAQNDSAYNVSISNVKLKVGGKEYTVDSKSVLPFSGVSMPVKGLSNNINGTVIYSTINDNGGTNKREAKID